ncbi:MAG: deoxyribose-phosphate aldolase [Candidatus Bipolaricaulota bacterium]|nr:deoxyribose-phosphate aldolase [Candidatus Bipolaricaulota bacterium]MDW8126231.1 deoxyribose-phosphate aldolase [Candidatus Bipolaricaulota bacterium]
MRKLELARLIDHTALGPDVDRPRVEKICQEAIQHKFYSVCVPPTFVGLARQILRDTGVKICTAVGFPHGQHRPEVKAAEARMAVEDGADEVDMVIHVPALKARDYAYVFGEIRAVREATQKAARPIVLKVILECALLTDEEKVAGAILVKAAGADFVKTSTGFGPGGATPEDVALLRRVVGPNFGVKAAGGIRDYATAVRMVEAGANRLGASRSLEILAGAPD